MKYPPEISKLKIWSLKYLTSYNFQHQCNITTAFTLSNYFFNRSLKKTSPILSSAINWNFRSWLVLTLDLIQKYLKLTIVTHYMHFNQEGQIIQTTKATTILDDYFPISKHLNVKSHNIITTILSYTITRKAYGDLVGHLSITSSQDATDFFIIYDYGSNAILVKTLLSKSGPDIRSRNFKIYLGYFQYTFILFITRMRETVIPGNDRYRVGFYMGPEMHHYRCFTCYFISHTSRTIYRHSNILAAQSSDPSKNCTWSHPPIIRRYHHIAEEPDTASFLSHSEWSNIQYLMTTSGVTQNK